MDILIVEDEAVLAMVYLLQLRGLGFHDVGMVASGRDALAAVEASQPKLILLDIKLRGDIDGIEVAEIIRRRHAVPIVFITAFSDAETLRRAWLTGPACILGKTGSGHELGRVVAELMKAERRVS